MYELVPDDVDNVNFYANVLYLFSNRAEGLRLKKDANRLATGTKLVDVIALEYKQMEARENIELLK